MNPATSFQTQPIAANIGHSIRRFAESQPDSIAVAMPQPRRGTGKRRYKTITFSQLEADSNRIAAGLQQLGVHNGTRLVLMVRPSIEFIALTFGLFKSGAVVVLIDPGMGRHHLLDCLRQVRPEGFVAIPPVHAVRTVLRHRLPEAKINVTVGRRWFWGGATLRQIMKSDEKAFRPQTTSVSDPAAIIFTTGSTGPPKGVLYRHGNFSSQVQQIRDRYVIEPGETDLPGFPLFGLFNAAMGVTTVIPDMDPTRPAQVNPRNIIEAIEDWDVTQAFGSPAIWNVVGRHCERHQIRLPSVKRVLSAGAPVPAHVLRRMKTTISPEGDIHTPYGATESLPVASISATEVLQETASQTDVGAGTCVGTRFSGIDWKVIRIDDGPISRIEEVEEVPSGEIGELIVRGSVVTREYFTRRDANAFAKINDHETFWHRMGDVGYFDDRHRFWFCGRKAHRVTTRGGTMFTVPCEAIFNCHQQVYRSALVGVGAPGEQLPVMIVELHGGSGSASWAKLSTSKQQKLIGELFALGQANELTKAIRKEHILIHESLPVDIRHNAKIFREKLATWATDRLSYK